MQPGAGAARRARWLARAIVVAAGAGALAGSAAAAGPGETFLVGGLPLPADAIPAGVSGDEGGGIGRVAVSANGRYVAFVSSADALSAAAHPDVINVYRKDRVTGEVVLVTRADGADGAPAMVNAGSVAISDDGARVAFLTRAALAPGDGDGRDDVYVRDLDAGTTTLATPGTAERIDDFDLAGGGQWIAFATLERLENIDTNGVSDVYRRAVAAGMPQLVSVRAGGGAAGNGGSDDPAISDDGAWVAFASTATDVAAPFTDGVGFGSDVFVRDMGTAVTYLVSNVPGQLSRSAGGASSEPVIAGAPQSGRPETVRIAYTSSSTNIEPADNSNNPSIYLRVGLNDAAGATLVSRADGLAGANANARARTPSLSDAGTHVVFTSEATNLTDGAVASGVYVRDVALGRTRLASGDTRDSVQGALSDNGATIVWHAGRGLTSDADHDLPAVYARVAPPPLDRLGAIALVSRPPGDAPFLLPAVSADISRPGARRISADGRYVVFSGYSSRLPGGSTDLSRVYRRDTLTGEIVLVSRANGPDGAPGDVGAFEPSISADGTRVAFETAGSLDPADGDSLEDVYVRDLAAAATVLASRADGAGGAKADARATAPKISADGRHVVFHSAAGNLGAPAGQRHVYVRDIDAGRTVVVDRADGPAGAIAERDANNAAISGDGRIVVWTTASRNLHPDDAAAAFSTDLYLRDTVADTTRLLSRRSGADGAKTTEHVGDVALSDDARVVAFETRDEALAPEGGPWGGSSQIVARDLLTHQNTLVSRAPGGPAGDSYSAQPSIDADGSVIAFSTTAENLLPGRGGDNRRAVIARDMTTGALGGPPAFGITGNPPHSGVYGPSVSADGECVTFVGRGHNAATGSAGDIQTVYVHVLSGACPKPVAGGPPGEEPRVARRRPSITRASLLRRRFRVGAGPTAVTVGRGATASRRRRARHTPAGTAFRFTLTARANVTIAIDRAERGRKVGRACRRPTRKLRGRKACVRWVAVRPSLSRRGLAARRHGVAFSGRIGRRPLRPGSYRATLRAANADGVSAPVRLPFTVVRR